MKKVPVSGRDLNPTGERRKRQRSGFFSSENRSGSSPSDGCNIGASTLRGSGGRGS
jgi:hypothetical protein